jgi:hypothetical protein
VANGRRTKNFIPAVRIGDEVITDQDRKVEAFSSAFQDILGVIQNREHGINLEELNLPRHDLSELELFFTE